MKKPRDKSREGVTSARASFSRGGWGAGRWSALSTASRVARSRKSAGVRTYGDARALIGDPASFSSAGRARHSRRRQRGNHLEQSAADRDGAPPRIQLTKGAMRIGNRLQPIGPRFVVQFEIEKAVFVPLTPMRRPSPVTSLSHISYRFSPGRDASTRRLVKSTDDDSAVTPSIYPARLGARMVSTGRPPKGKSPAISGITLA
jgi:hypothetical protein